MKLILSILCLLIAGLNASAQLVRPIQSESMYKQLRSMEDGPWEFSPEGYYYSWYMKKIKLGFISFKTKFPGLGVHDRGAAGSGLLGDGYVNKYKPSGQVRAKMLALTEISRKQYEAIAEKHKDMGQREALDAADRQVDVAIKLYESKINTFKANILRICIYYDRFKGYSASQAFLDELTRIESNISYIGKGYMRNAERSAAYLKEINNLKRLSSGISITLERDYAIQRAGIIKM